MDWTITAIKYKDVLEFLCKTKCPFRLLYHLCILGDAIIAVAVESLIRIVREGKHDADFIHGKKIYPVSKLYYWTFTSKSQPEEVNG